MKLYIFTESRQSQTLIEMGRATYVMMIKQNYIIITKREGCTAFTINGNWQSATKCLLLQEGHPAQASVNKD